jgi:hypothetical protein
VQGQLVVEVRVAVVVVVVVAVVLQRVWLVV